MAANRLSPTTHRTPWHHRIARRLAALALAVCAVPALAAIPSSERQVLLDLYDATHGDSWTNSTQLWKSGGTFQPAGSECNWFGITCDAGGNHVTEVWLGTNNLVGTLPGNLNQLTALSYFYVPNNQLSGPIPSLAGLAALDGFVAASNQLSGGLPSLSGLTALRQFVVGSNQLSGPIPVLSGVPALLQFVVSNNQLTGPIPSLSGLTLITEFDAENNQLNGPIPALAGLADLVLFMVSNNQLQGPIPSLSGLGRLKVLRVYNNQLTGVPPAAPASLGAGGSSLCPNFLTAPSPTDAAWNTATGTTPWSATCTAAPAAAAVAVPTLGEGALTLLGSALAASAALVSRRRRMPRQR